MTELALVDLSLNRHSHRRFLLSQPTLSVSGTSIHILAHTHTWWLPIRFSQYALHFLRSPAVTATIACRTCICKYVSIINSSFSYDALSAGRRRRKYIMGYTTVLLWRTARYRTSNNRQRGAMGFALTICNDPNDLITLSFWFGWGVRSYERLKSCS